MYPLDSLLIVFEVVGIRISENVIEMKLEFIKVLHGFFDDIPIFEMFEQVIHLRNGSFSDSFDVMDFNRAHSLGIVAVLFRESFPTRFYWQL